MSDYLPDYAPWQRERDERVRRITSLPRMPIAAEQRLRHEQAMVGALARGTLPVAETRALPDAWWMPGGIGEHHARIVCAVEAVAEVLGRVKLDAVLRLLADPLAGRVIGGRCVGYLVGLARTAPNRRGAVEALRGVIDAARAAELAEEDARLEANARERRAQSTEARALQMALAALLDGDEAAALSAMARAERAIVGVTLRDLDEAAEEASMGRWKATATWVPRGARLAEGQSVTLYEGDDEAEARSIVRRFEPLFKWFVADGIVLLDVEEDGDARVRRWAQPTAAMRVAPPPRSPGYPACSCGAPMVPGDIAGIALRERELFCVGACGKVRVTPDERWRAQTAAKAGREGRAA